MVHRIDNEWLGITSYSGSGNYEGKINIGINPEAAPPAQPPAAVEIGQPIVNSPVPSSLDDFLPVINNLPSIPVELVPVTSVVPSPIGSSTPDQVQTYNKEYITFQVAKEGFGSYLDGIVPNDVAITAGAFSATMQQVKNILSVDFEKFAQVAFAMETTKGLDLINGTNVPADVQLAIEGYTLTALGSGPNGTYTMSDLFGCMSGLTYPWKNLYDGILELQTDKLKTIYDQLYLAAQWEGATGTVQYSPSATLVDPFTPTYDYYYTVTGVTLTDAGGGYGRSAASTPTVTITGGSGATATATISTDNTSLGSNGVGNYGRVISLTLTSAGSPVNYGSGSSGTPPAVGSPPLIEIQTPPTAATSYPYTGGNNTSYGTTYTTGSVNTAVAGLIADANAEIAVIRTTRPIKATNLNTLHNVTGSQLTIEQRARFNGIAPVPQGIRDKFLNLYPSALLVFVQSIPELAKNTLPHMQVQTLEAISNLDLTAGQSIVGAMREARNAARLDAIGVPQDNVIEGVLTPEQELALLLNGTTVSTVPAPTDQSPGIYNFPSVPFSPTAVAFTKPAYPTNTRNDIPLIPTPVGYFNGTDIMLTPNIVPNSPEGDPAVLLPIINGQTLPQLAGTNVVLPNITNTPNTPNTPNVSNTPNIIVVPEPTKRGTASSLVGPGPHVIGKFAPVGGWAAGPQVTPTPTVSSDRGIVSPFAASVIANPSGGNVAIPYPTVGVVLPTGPAVPLDVGKAPLGSFAPSKAVNLLPPNLKFTSSVVLPSTFSVPEAIEEVIKCNCDCWLQ